ncbi:hypothetical protein [Kitasatospora sp. MMS16-BH015]|nr:hypothetical protein [Kitasatospora sp. MMS16-BH015]
MILLALLLPPVLLLSLVLLGRLEDRMFAPRRGRHALGAVSPPRSRR